MVWVEEGSEKLQVFHGSRQVYSSLGWLRSCVEEEQERRVLVKVAKVVGAGPSHHSYSC